MTIYYLPHLLCIEDYKVMYARYLRIINSMPEFSCKNKFRTSRRIIRYRKDDLTIVFKRKNDLRYRHEITIDCKGNRDTFYVYDYNCPVNYRIGINYIRNNPIEAIELSALKGEVLDFIDDYCVIQQS